MNDNKLKEIEEKVVAIYNGYEDILYQRQHLYLDTEPTDDPELIELAEKLFDLLHGDVEYGDCKVFKEYNNVKKGKDEVKNQKESEVVKRKTCEILIDFAHRFVKNRKRVKNSFPDYLRFQISPPVFRKSSDDTERKPHIDLDKETFDFDNLIDDLDEEFDDILMEDTIKEEELGMAAVESVDYDVISLDEERAEREKKRDERKQQMLKNLKNEYMAEQLFDVSIWLETYKNDYERIKEAYEKKYQPISDSNLIRSINMAIKENERLKKKFKKKK